jgi:hypothetical protein
MTLVEAAKRALEQVGHPMHSKEIIAYAKSRGWINPRGKTPDHSLQAAIFKHIRQSGSGAIFTRIGKTPIHRKYALRGQRYPKGGVTSRKRS